MNVWMRDHKIGIVLAFLLGFVFHLCPKNFSFVPFQMKMLRHERLSFSRMVRLVYEWNSGEWFIGNFNLLWTIMSRCDKNKSLRMKNGIGRVRERERKGERVIIYTQWMNEWIFISFVLHLDRFRKYNPENGHSPLCPNEFKWHWRTRTIRWQIGRQSLR